MAEDERPCTDEELAILKDLYSKSTRVVAWYSHPYKGEVRGPFCRWINVTEVAPEYKNNVADVGDECNYIAAALNSVPKLLNLVDKLKKQLGDMELELEIDRELRK